MLNYIFATGETMRVECVFTLKPVRFEWYRGIIPIKLDPRASIGFDESSLCSTLEIAHCRVSDEARYSVQVEDSEGDCLDAATFSLSVKGEHEYRLISDSYSYGIKI